ncbi:(3,5-dihydroxyphenyl)acetyl-CoA 1,2-dioxygenase DpgC [Amycolatopsis sp. NPDC004747]
MTTSTSTLDSWADAELPHGTFDHDRAALTRHTSAGEDLLAELRPKPDRGPAERRTAERVHESCRRWRARFLHRHAAGLYDELTGGRANHVRLAELAFAAAEAVPGLVPTRRQIDGERQVVQADKEGREIDQGLFFRGLLRVPDVGDHLLDAMALPTARARELLPEFAATGRLDLGAVRIERRGAAAHVTTRNVRCLNAEDDALIGDMEVAVDLALLDDQVRVGVLRGGPMTHPRYLGRRVFSAGINLTDLHQGRISFVDFLLRREVGYISKLVHGVLVDSAADAWPHRTLDKPWIAAVDSFAIGGGMQLLLAVDHVIAGADVYFSLPAAQEGIVPGAANFRLPRVVGGRLARQMILGGRTLWAGEPEAGLLVDDVVDPQEVGAAVEAAVSRLDSPAVTANRRMINLVGDPRDEFREYMAEFAVAQVRRAYSADVLEKVGRRVADRLARHGTAG